MIFIVSLDPVNPEGPDQLYVYGLVPPVLRAVSCEFCVMHTEPLYPMLAEREAPTVIGKVGKEAQPVEVFVNVKVAVPADIPVTTPAFVTVATDGLLLVQVPPVAGDKLVVLARQMIELPLILTVGLAMTVTLAVGAELQLVLLNVNMNVTTPAPTPVTTPPFVTVAIDVLLLVHVPPVVGDNVVVPPPQIVVAPVILTAGLTLTVTFPVELD